MENSRFIVAGRLIDGSDGPIQADMLLHLQNGYIQEMRKVGPEDLGRADLLDLSHCTILPALVDSHVHLVMSGTDDPAVRKHQLTAGYDEIKEVIARHLNDHLAHGVYAVRDGGDKQAHALRYKTESFDFEKIPVHLSVAGRGWHKPGRYGGLVGRAPSGKDTLASAIAHEREPVDHVKIVNSGLNSLTHFGKETAPQFDRGEMTAAVQAARDRGLKVMVHANGKMPVRIAVQSGCHSIEHGFFMGEENLQRMADRGVIWVPTAVPMKAYAEHLKNRSAEAVIARKNLDHQIEQISRARQIGVTIALGTDAGSLGVHHGRAVIEELGLLMEAGFAIQEAVKCATANGAELLGLKHGRLAKGTPATFVAAKGDPSRLPKSLEDIEKMYVNGVDFAPRPSGSRSRDAAGHDAGEINSD